MTHFSILLDHALKHCANSSFLMLLRKAVTLALMSSTPSRRVPFSFGKRKKSQGAKSDGYGG